VAFQEGLYEVMTVFVAASRGFLTLIVAMFSKFDVLTGWERKRGDAEFNGPWGGS
jgi:hypothetical protein